MTLTWTERMSVGNAAIDSEHRDLIGMLNNVERALRAGDQHELLRAFKLLTDGVRIHFMNEEKIAQAAEYPVEYHQRTHQYLQKELQYIRDELEAKGGLWSQGAVEHFSRMLRNWLLDHLSKEDELLKPTLQTLPYDFTPG